jgi:hypothetical protein
MRNLKQNAITEKNLNTLIQKKKSLAANLKFTQCYNLFIDIHLGN